jgi:hypothetical protein
MRGRRARTQEQSRLSQSFRIAGRSLSEPRLCQFAGLTTSQRVPRMSLVVIKLQNCATIVRSHRACANLDRGRNINSPNPRRRSAPRAHRAFHGSAFATTTPCTACLADRCRLFDFGEMTVGASVVDSVATCNEVSTEERIAQGPSRDPGSPDLTPQTKCLLV